MAVLVTPEGKFLLTPEGYILTTPEQPPTPANDLAIRFFAGRTRLEVDLSEGASPLSIGFDQTDDPLAVGFGLGNAPLDVTQVKLDDPLAVGFGLGNAPLAISLRVLSEEEMIAITVLRLDAAGGCCVVRVHFYDPALGGVDDAAADKTPKTITWNLRDKNRAVVNGHTSETVAVVGVTNGDIDVLLSGADLANDEQGDPKKIWFGVQATIDHLTLGNDIPQNAECVIEIPSMMTVP